MVSSFKTVNIPTPLGPKTIRFALGGPTHRRLIEQKVLTSAGNLTQEFLRRAIISRESIAKQAQAELIPELTKGGKLAPPAELIPELTKGGKLAPPAELIPEYVKVRPEIKEPLPRLMESIKKEDLSKERRQSIASFEKTIKDFGKKTEQMEFSLQPATQKSLFNTLVSKIRQKKAMPTSIAKPSVSEMSALRSKIKQLKMTPSFIKEVQHNLQISGPSSSLKSLQTKNNNKQEVEKQLKQLDKEIQETEEEAFETTTEKILKNKKLDGLLTTTGVSSGTIQILQSKVDSLEEKEKLLLKQLKKLYQKREELSKKLGITSLSIKDRFKKLFGNISPSTSKPPSAGGGTPPPKPPNGGPKPPEGPPKPPSDTDLIKRSKIQSLIKEISFSINQFKVYLTKLPKSDLTRQLNTAIELIDARFMDVKFNETNYDKKISLLTEIKTEIENLLNSLKKDIDQYSKCQEQLEILKKRLNKLDTDSITTRNVKDLINRVNKLSCQDKLNIKQDIDDILVRINILEEQTSRETQQLQQQLAELKEEQPVSKKPPLVTLEQLQQVKLKPVGKQPVRPSLSPKAGPSGLSIEEITKNLPKHQRISSLQSSKKKVLASKQDLPEEDLGSVRIIEGVVEPKKAFSKNPKFLPEGVFNIADIKFKVKSRQSLPASWKTHSK